MFNVKYSVALLMNRDPRDNLTDRYFRTCSPYCAEVPLKINLTPCRFTIHNPNRIYNRTFRYETSQLHIQTCSNNFKPPSNTPIISIKNSQIYPRTKKSSRNNPPIVDSNPLEQSQNTYSTNDDKRR